MKKITLATLIFVGILILIFALNAATVWVICWALKAIGIYAICGWTVEFSWPLVIIFTIVYSILRAIFGNNNSKNKN